MSKMYRPIWKAVSGTPIAGGETGKAEAQRRRPAVLASMVAAVTLVGTPGAAQAALVSVCTGVSLPPSTITTMLNPLVTELAEALPLAGLPTIWAGIAAGAPVRLNVLDTAGNPVLSTAVCDATADSYALNTPKGISIGGNKITGLGITTVANAGETGSAALGNGATTNAAATNSIALGTNASVGAAGANSVALGAGSAANTGAQVAYAAFGLAAPRTSVGEVSVGSVGSLRKTTNLAPGSALTDGVNVEQLQAVDNAAVKYDNPALKLTVTLGGVGGTRISNLAPGVAGTDAVNLNQLLSIATSIKYFHANSTAADSQATGAGSIAIGPQSVASAINSMAAGNGAVTNGAATSSIALGTNASVGAAGANSVALGAGSTANTGAQVAYAAFGLATPRTSVGEVSVGSVGSLRKTTNLAPGSALTDAVNVEQLQSVDNNAVKYDTGLKLTVTLGGVGGTRISNLAPGVAPTDAVNVNQLQTIATTPTKYFHANSTAADSQASGAESIAIGPQAVASATSSMAAGNGAVTNAAAANSIALGTGASVGAAGANSVALGAGSAANTGAQVNYTPFGLPKPRTSVGEVSVGSAAGSRKITNVAPGSAPGDAVNVEQLQAALKTAQHGDDKHHDDNHHADDNHHDDNHHDDNHHHGSQDELEHEISVLMQQVRGLQDQVVALQTQLTDMHTQLGSVEAIAPHVSLETVNGHDTVRFSNVNLQVVNGQGSTASANGLGNLIIGYDEADTSGLYHCTIGTNPATQTPVANETDCVAAGGEWLNTGFKTGSHYLVLGTQNNYSRWGGLIVGSYNTSNFDFASVSGGVVNTASGSSSSVSGGHHNTASGSYSSVSGGGGNTASGNGSSVTGAGGNTTGGNGSSVTGAGGNTTSSNGSSVTGGL